MIQILTFGTNVVIPVEEIRVPPLVLLEFVLQARLEKLVIMSAEIVLLAREYTVISNALTMSSGFTEEAIVLLDVT